MWFNTLYANLSLPANNLISRIQIYRELLSYGPDQKWVSVVEPRYVMESRRAASPTRTGDSTSSDK